MARFEEKTHFQTCFNPRTITYIANCSFVRVYRHIYNMISTFWFLTTQFWLGIIFPKLVINNDIEYV